MSNCRSCGEEIIWAKSIVSGKLMPVDILPSPSGNVLVNDNGVADVLGSESVSSCRINGVPLHLSHFATCKFAWQHRKGK